MIIYRVKKYASLWKNCGLTLVGMFTASSETEARKHMNQFRKEAKSKNKDCHVVLNKLTIRVPSKHDLLSIFSDEIVDILNEDTEILAEFSDHNNDM